MTDIDMLEYVPWNSIKFEIAFFEDGVRGPWAPAIMDTLNEMDSGDLSLLVEGIEISIRDWHGTWVVSGPWGERILPEWMCGCVIGVALSYYTAHFTKPTARV